MPLNEDLSEHLKQAMKTKEQLRVDVIRMIKAAIQHKELELKRQLDEAETTRTLTTLVKQRKEAAELYQKANRADLLDKEMKEIEIIEQYLPKAPSEEEMARAIQGVIQETGAKTMGDMGQVMKTVMSRFGGRPVDGKRVSDLVRAMLQT